MWLFAWFSFPSVIGFLTSDVAVDLSSLLVRFAPCFDITFISTVHTFIELLYNLLYTKTYYSESFIIDS